MFDINPQVMRLTHREAERRVTGVRGGFAGWLLGWLRQARLALGFI